MLGIEHSACMNLMMGASSLREIPLRLNGKPIVAANFTASVSRFCRKYGIGDLEVFAELTALELRCTPLCGPDTLMSIFYLLVEHGLSFREGRSRRKGEFYSQAIGCCA